MTSLSRQEFTEQLKLSKIHHISEIKEGSKLLLAVRASTEIQQNKGSLRSQELQIREFVRKQKATIVGTPIYHVGKGSDLFWLNEVSSLAVEQDTDGVVFYNLQRILRPKGYDGTNDSAWLQTEDFERFRDVSGMVKFWICEDPTSPPGTLRSAETKRGNEFKKIQPGNFFTRLSRKQSCFDLVLEFSKTMGYKNTARKVTRLTGFPMTHMTVKRWIQQG